MGVKEGSDVRKKNSMEKAEKQTEINAMDCSQQGNDRKKGKRDTEREGIN